MHDWCGEKINRKKFIKLSGDILMLCLVVLVSAINLASSKLICISCQSLSVFNLHFLHYGIRQSLIFRRLASMTFNSFIADRKQTSKTTVVVPLHRIKLFHFIALSSLNDPLLSPVRLSATHFRSMFVLHQHFQFS